MNHKVILFFVLLSAIFACKQEGKIEIVPNYNSIYLSQNLSQMPSIIQGNEDELTKAVKKFIDENFPSESDKVKLDYNFLINENGSIDKILTVNSMNEKVDNFILQSVSDWKFSPGKKNGSIVKSQFNYKYYSGIYAPFENEKDYLTAAEVMPEIVGGFKALLEKIIYPESAKKASIEGKVFVQAFIDEQGNPSNVRIIKGVDSSLDKSALDAVSAIKFTPGMQQGKAVKVQVTVPIYYKLQ